jgi:hypothetical protein
MAKPQRVVYFKASLEDKPGALLSVAKDLKSKNLGLVGFFGVDTAQGRAELYVIPRNAVKVRNAWKTSGINFEEGTGFFLKGADKTGVLVKSLEAIAQAGVNIVASGAIAVKGQYGSFLWVAQSDVEKTAQALGLNLK